jgi:hypothetical protein
MTPDTSLDTEGELRTELLNLMNQPGMVSIRAQHHLRRLMELETPRSGLQP